MMRSAQRAGAMSWALTIKEGRMAELTLKIDASDVIARLNNAAIRDVISERARHLSEEGWTPEHDDEHDQGELSCAGAVYALLASSEMLDDDSELREGMTRKARSLWPWGVKWLKPGSVRRMLVKAAALIIAEIERLDRAAERRAQELADEAQKMGLY